MGIAEASDEINLNQFAVKYFEAKVATQDPEATPQILEAYSSTSAPIRHCNMPSQISCVTAPNITVNWVLSISQSAICSWS